MSRLLGQLITKVLIPSFCPELKGFILIDDEEPNDFNYLIKDNKIKLSKRLFLSNRGIVNHYALRAIVHELIHARQIMSGKLTVSKKGGTVRWKNTSYKFKGLGAKNITTGNYIQNYKLPFEIGADLCFHSWIKKNQHKVTAYMKKESK